MKATKFTMSIEVNTLSMDSIPALLQDVALAIKDKVADGSLTKEDGDNVFWNTSKEDVTF